MLKVMKEYEAVIRKVFGPMAGQVAGHTVQRLLGFWCVWHLMGGADGARLLGISDRQVRRTRVEFVEAFGVDVADFLPDEAAAMLKAAKRGT